MATLPLTNRPDFFEVLEQTRLEVENLAARGSGHGPMKSVAVQLEVMKRQTAGGRNPTEDERDAITIGLIAVRELEPPSSESMADLIERLHELNGYFREWPDP
ncbi:MAG TPA: hypothetical protein PKA58_34080 [Polyangium sp.]|nr:hypothetical protein [Polyangium sp.]